VFGLGFVDDYLLETTALSALLDSQHPRHAAATAIISALDTRARKYVSVIALAELMYGFRLYQAARRTPHPNATHTISSASTYLKLNVTIHTSKEYEALKTNIATTYLNNVLSRKERRRWIEDWCNQFTGKKLCIDENDLWMCAQARERNVVLITSDENMTVIVSMADPMVRFMLIK
jgi:tRNA(fMet)-specific endonuclease VapC